MFIPLTIFVLLGAYFALTGARLLRNREGWGAKYVERRIPRGLCMGTVDTHRKILGAGWLVIGTVFVVVGA